MSSLVYVSRNLIDYANYSNGDLAGRRGAEMGVPDYVPSTHQAQIIIISLQNFILRTNGLLLSCICVFCDVIIS